MLTSLAPVLDDSNARVLDLCCGTGDVLFTLQRGAKAQVLGADFCHPMLLLAQRKGQGGAQLFEADALTLPLAENSLDAIAVSFGFRNLANYGAGLTEFARALKPGGTLAILEFSHPESFLTRTAYNFYSRTLLPLIGGAISGSREAYTYLPESIQRFPRAENLRTMMTRAGFDRAQFQLLSGGIAALHTGRCGRVCHGGDGIAAQDDTHVPQ